MRQAQAVATPTRMSILANALKRLGTFSFRTSEQAESGAAMNMPGLSISPLNGEFFHLAIDPLL